MNEETIIRNFQDIFKSLEDINTTLAKLEIKLRDK